LSIFSNVAVTAVSDWRSTPQKSGEVPARQLPADHPMNLEPAAGLAMSGAGNGMSSCTTQSVPHESRRPYQLSDSSKTTVPVPDPALVMVSRCRWTKPVVTRGFGPA
jgi:hypothetical protein